MVHIIHHSLPLTFILITQETRSLKTFWGMRTKPWQFEKKSKLSSDTCWTIGQVTFIISHVIFCLCKLNGKGNYSRIKLKFMNELTVPKRWAMPNMRQPTVLLVLYIILFKQHMNYKYFWYSHHYITTHIRSMKTGTILSTWSSTMTITKTYNKHHTELQTNTLSSMSMKLSPKNCNKGLWRILAE